MEKNSNHKKNINSREEKIQQIADSVQNFKSSKNNIDGIFNYCDRWCERCQFTNRCSNYELTQKLGLGQDANMEDLKVNIEGIFKGTIQMIEANMNSMDIDMADIESFETTKISEVKNNRALDSAKIYSTQVANWFTNNKSYLLNLSNDLLNISEQSLLDFNNNIEVINWYMFFIGVKINRAYDDFIDDDEFNEYDQSGSAKLALIAIDNSINAFTNLLTTIKTKEDDILYFLSILSQIKKILEVEKPNARNFIRPGFDENN